VTKTSVSVTPTTSNSLV